MSMSADTRAALVEARIGLSKEELFAHTGAPDERKYYALISSLKGSGKIKVGGERGGVPYYVIVDWPEGSLRSRQPDAAPAADKPTVPKKRRAIKPVDIRGNDSIIVVEGTDGPSPPDGGAQFAISEDGVLGIEKDEAKIKLDRGEFERLRTFIDRAEEVWKVRPA